MPSDKKKVSKKTMVVGVNKIPASATILDVAKAFTKLSKDISEIKIVNVKSEYRNALITFNSVEACEKAKEMGSIKLDNTESPIYFTHGSNNKVNVSASTDKIYVRYPVEDRYNDIVNMINKLSTSVSIVKPEYAKNYFFATCSGIEEQCKIVKELNNKNVEGGVLSVKIAVDRSNKRRFGPKAH